MAQSQWVWCGICFQKLRITSSVAWGVCCVLRVADGKRGEWSLQPGVMLKAGMLECCSTSFGDPLGVDSTCLHPPSMPWSVAVSGVHTHVIENFLSQIEIRIVSTSWRLTRIERLMRERLWLLHRPAALKSFSWAKAGRKFLGRKWPVGKHAPSVRVS